MSWKEDITKAIDEYSIAKEIADEQGKIAQSLSQKVKLLLKDNDLDEFETDSNVVSITEISKDVIDEESLIPTLKSMFTDDVICELVKTKEYINMDKLEDMLYNREISPDIVNAFLIHKPKTIRLNIKKRS